MRDCPVFVPELDLVAVDGEKIVGNVVCLKSHIAGDDGKHYEVLSLGPIGILLCGDPDYYTRQGFVAAENLGIRNAENMYADALHVCELQNGALTDAKGCYFEDDIYNIDETKVQEFDKQFPKKEAIQGVGMQQKFEMMVKRVRPYQP